MGILRDIIDAFTDHTTPEQEAAMAELNEDLRSQRVEKLMHKTDEMDAIVEALKRQRVERTKRESLKSLLDNNAAGLYKRAEWEGCEGELYVSVKPDIYDQIADMVTTTDDQGDFDWVFEPLKAVGMIGDVYIVINNNQLLDYEIGGVESLNREKFYQHQPWYF